MLNWELGSITKRNLDFIFILLICSSSISYPVSTAKPIDSLLLLLLLLQWLYAHNLDLCIYILTFNCRLILVLNQQQSLGQVFRSHSHNIPYISNIVYNALFKLLYAFIASYLNICISWHDGCSVWKKIFSGIWR